MKGVNHRGSLMTTTHLTEAPPWMRSDQYIKTGYRRCLGSANRCLASLLYVHNELVNVWSHLLPGTIHMIALVRECYTFYQQWDERRYIDQLFVWQYIASCILCLLFSAGYHTLAAHSSTVAGRWLKLDYLGIILNTAAGCSASTYFGLRHHPKLQLLYLACSGILALILFMVLLAPAVDGAPMAFWRSILFASFVASGFVPMIHACRLDGASVLGFFPLAHAVGMVTCYLTGTIFYLSRFPERRYPVKYDIWGSSHQIFHSTIVVGQLVFIRGLRQLAAQYNPELGQVVLEYGKVDAGWVETARVASGLAREL